MCRVLCEVKENIVYYGCEYEFKKKSFFFIGASPIITHVLELVRLKQYSFGCSKFALKSFNSVLDTLTLLDSSSTRIKILMKQILTRVTVSKLTNEITR